MTPLVLVHGFLGGGKQWDHVVDALPNLDILAPDLPGFGDNNRLSPCTSINQMARYIVEKADAEGIFEFDLLGHSMGGMIAQEIALEYPSRVRKLVLYSTGSIGALPGRFETIETSKQRAKDDGVAITAGRISATWYRDFEKSPYHANCAEIARQASPAALQSGLDAMAGWNRQDDIYQIKSPTLIVWGDKDRTYSREQVNILNRQIKDSCLKIIPNSSHAVHDEQKDQFIDLISKFLLE